MVTLYIVTLVTLLLCTSEAAQDLIIALGVKETANIHCFSNVDTTSFINRRVTIVALW